MQNPSEQSKLWPNAMPSNPDDPTNQETPVTAVSKTWLPKYGTFLAVLLLIAVIFVTTYFAPNKDVTRFNGLEACKKQCAPRFGEIKGEPIIPNSSPLERRYSEINVKCVCS